MENIVLTMLLCILFSSGSLGTLEDYDSYNSYNNHHTSDDYQPSYDYPDATDEEYDQGHYGASEQDYSDEQGAISIREYEVDDTNCMGVDSYQMTAEMSNCCEILKSKSTDIPVDKIEKCIALRLHHYYGVPVSYDTEKDVTSNDRRSYGKSCIAFGDPILLEYICCGRKSCKNWKRKMVQSVCQACFPVCPSCRQQRKLY